MPQRTITAVIHDGAVHADCGLPLPWWNFSKTALAAAALALVAQDRLSLDEPVKGKPFTLRQLLQHRAGLPDYGALPAYHRAVAARELPWLPAELMERVQANTLIFEPGGGWRYSNVGYVFVRGLIEEAAREPLDQALRRLTFDPLTSKVSRAQRHQAN
jgi:D-alanyl-D-alanine carboxypeptidase